MLLRSLDFYLIFLKKGKFRIGYIGMKPFLDVYKEFAEFEGKILKRVKYFLRNCNHQQLKIISGTHKFLRAENVQLGDCKGCS